MSCDAVTNKKKALLPRFTMKVSASRIFQILKFGCNLLEWIGALLKSRWCIMVAIDVLGTGYHVLGAWRDNFSMFSWVDS